MTKAADDVLDGSQALGKRRPKVSEVGASDCWTCSNSLTCVEVPIGAAV
jgi:hypothetical protein